MALPRYTAKTVRPQTGGGTAQFAQAQVFETAGSLVDKFRDYQFEQTAIQRAQEGKKKALEDFSANRELELADTSTFYGRSYNEKAQALHKAKVSNNIDNKYRELALEYEDNPQAFLEASQVI